MRRLVLKSAGPVSYMLTATGMDCLNVRISKNNCVGSFYEKMENTAIVLPYQKGNEVK